MRTIITTTDTFRCKSLSRLLAGLAEQDAKVLTVNGNSAAGRIFCLQLPSAWSRGWLFWPLLPLFTLTWVANYLLFLRHKKKNGAGIVLLPDHRGRISLSLPALWSGFQVVWADVIGSADPAYPLPLRRLARRIRIIHFRPDDRLRWQNFGLSDANFRLLPLGIPQKDLKRQENIFEKIAHNGNQRKKFFSLVAIADLDRRQHLEQIFHAIKQALTFVKDLQLTVIGDGAERQKLKWLADKIGVGSQVWFVGEQKFLHKWLENADAFVECGDRIGQNECWTALYAAATGLPLILPQNTALEDFFSPGQSAVFTDIRDHDRLSQAIIELKQKRSLQLKLIREAKNMVDNNHTLAKMLREFEIMVDSY